MHIGAPAHLPSIRPRRTSRNPLATGASSPNGRPTNPLVSRPIHRRTTGRRSCRAAVERERYCAGRSRGRVGGRQRPCAEARARRRALTASLPADVCVVRGETRGGVGALGGAVGVELAGVGQRLPCDCLRFGEGAGVKAIVRDVELRLPHLGVDRPVDRARHRQALSPERLGAGGPICELEQPGQRDEGVGRLRARAGAKAGPSHRFHVEGLGRPRRGGVPVRSSRRTCRGAARELRAVREARRNRTRSAAASTRAGSGCQGMSMRQLTIASPGYKTRVACSGGGRALAMAPAGARLPPSTSSLPSCCAFQQRAIRTNAFTRAVATTVPEPREAATPRAGRRAKRETPRRSLPFVPPAGATSARHAHRRSVDEDGVAGEVLDHP